MINRRFSTTVINSLLFGLLISVGLSLHAEPSAETQTPSIPPSLAPPSLAPKVAPVKFYVNDIKATMHEHVATLLDADGLFHVLDDKTGEDLALKFVKVHDPVRQIRGNIYFACTDFHVAGDPDKLYDIDFWLDGTTGKLVVYDTKVHKEPRRSLIYGWYKQPRYTFVKDEISYLY
ncbi:hypothetical protein OAD22_06570 [Pseudomonadales bacterium]|nr:hypothetical protein [Pseudomonadales bacterium]MDA9297403.1 hypothetical protein [Pseudomonadales bacterium]MDA9366500.1 hypothetical protein [Pseudomonadales bacterium]MDB9880064.1 hypothetical protein [Pseudomonadales bacterium]MDB9917412.1 hypothetical protein [Pseudomonadales bacterium]